MTLRPFKKIRELEDEIYMLRRGNNTLHESAERFCKKVSEQESGKHNCGIWCEGCENLIKEKSWNMVQGTYEAKFCKLENPCKDRKE